MRIRIQSVLALGALTGVAAIVTANAGVGRELLFSAPIQQIDQGRDSVTVLGQQFHTATTQLSVGQIVNVYGLLQKDGSIQSAVVQSTQAFGTNGDPVFLKGVVTDVDSALGRAQVDGLTIDYTSQLANPSFAVPTVGDVIAIAGSQPAVKGVLVASALGNGAYAVGLNSGGTSMDGIDASISLSSGTRAAGMSGGGISSAGMSGGGIISAGMSGGGISSAGMSGGGINSLA